MTDNRLPPGYVPLTAHTLNGHSSRGEGRARSDNNGNGESRRSGSRRGSDNYRNASSSRDRKGPGGRGGPQGGRKRQRPQRGRGGPYRRERDDDFEGEAGNGDDLEEFADEE